jgi:hypothetical protein
MAEVTLTCDQCHKQIDVVEGTVCPGCECGSMKWTMTEFRQTAVEHIHVWTRRVPGQVVCLGCGAREERPDIRTSAAGFGVTTFDGAPELPPIGSRWRTAGGRIAEVIAHGTVEPGEVVLRFDDGAVCRDPWWDVYTELARLDDDRPIVECSVCGYPTMGTRDDQLCSKCEVNDARAAAKALVDAAVASPPPGVHQRAWRAALMALEEHVHGEGGEIDEHNIGDARVLVERYARERGR